MTQVAVNFDLATHVDLGLFSADFILVEDFESADVVGGAVTDEVDAPKFALAEGFADFEESEV